MIMTSLLHLLTWAFSATRQQASEAKYNRALVFLDNLYTTATVTCTPTEKN